MLCQAFPRGGEDRETPAFAERVGALLDQNAQLLLERVVGGGPQAVAVDVQLALGEQEISPSAADRFNDAVGDDQSKLVALELSGPTSRRRLHRGWRAADIVGRWCISRRRARG